MSTVLRSVVSWFSDVDVGTTVPWRHGRYGIAALTVAVAMVLRLPLNPMLGDAMPFFLFTPAILIAAFYGGIGPGVFAVALCAVVGDFFFQAPFYSFGIADSKTLLPTVLFAVNSTMIALLGAGLHRAWHQAERHATETARNLDRLRQSEERTRRLAETAYEGIWSLDAEGIAMFVNARMAEMLAYPLSRVTARQILDFVFDEDKAAMASILEARRRGGFDIFEFRFRRNDGAPLPCTVSMQPIFDPEGAYLGCLLMLTDISDRVEQREELVKERQEVCHWVGQIHAGLDEIVGELRAASYGTAESPDPLGRQIDRLSELAEMSRETTQRLASETSDGSTNPAFRSNPLDGCAPSSHR